MATAVPNPNDPVWAQHIATQEFNLTDITGAVDTFSLTDIDDYFFLKSRSLIVFGVEIGLCMMLTIVLLLLTKPEKRRTLIFGLNIAGLVLETIRFIVTAINYNSSNFSVGVQFLGATAQLPGNFSVPLDIYSVVTIFWYAVVEASLVLQVRVVFGAERKLQTILTLGLGFLFTVTAVLKIAVQAIIFKAQLQKEGTSGAAFNGLDLAGTILFTITVGISSAIFVAKLVHLIHRRKKMGFHAFGPLQVILIMGAQCLLVPLAFFIADFYVDIDGFTTMGQTLLACSLPLSALWASFESEKHAPGIPVRPSFGNFTSGTSTSGGTEVQSKKSFFNFWRGDRETVGTEVEKGSFVSDSDHVMIQRTMHVAHSESPVPRSAGRGF